MGQALRRLTFVLSFEKCGCRSLIRFSLAGNLTLPFHAGKAFMETTSGQERLLPNPKLLLREHLTSF
jgi:hypothetical protein